MEEYEIIIINDGTRDGSFSIAKKFEIMYDNITVYSQENQGLSATRNRGLSLARSEKFGSSIQMITLNKMFKKNHK
jgi:glycosyltransferase involved in cell wall biosynthesis